jgi:Raf kinase inhibitor-like YbhB/YbcL family protein
MKTKLFLCFGVALAAAVSAFAQPKGPGTPGMTLSSSAFTDGAVIPNKYTQAVPNPVSLALAWTNVPGNPAAFVLIMHDPDVARNKTTEDQLHWLVINIPGSARSLPEGVPMEPKLPDDSFQGKNGGDTVGFRGPGAPAAGPNHHYTLELFALDTKLPLDDKATRSDVLKAMDGHVVAKAVLVGLFHRP